MSETKQLLETAGLHVATWSPGDGVTRYRLFESPNDYHSGEHIFTALGRKELITYLRGFIGGRASERLRNLKDNK